MKRPARERDALVFAWSRVAVIRESVSFGRTCTVTFWLDAVFHFAVYVVSTVGVVVNVKAPFVPVMSVATCWGDAPNGVARINTASLALAFEIAPEIEVWS